MAYNVVHIGHSLFDAHQYKEVKIYVDQTIYTIPIEDTKGKRYNEDIFNIRFDDPTQVLKLKSTGKNGKDQNGNIIFIPVCKISHIECLKESGLQEDYVYSNE